MRRGEMHGKSPDWVT
uniref:Uncharacterized protein n=1 Tax=Anguilla anguilla TaxID=7936 RepID=A0A0E9U667_ANGAN